MDPRRFERLARRVATLFPERHLSLRSDEDHHRFMLTSGQQLVIAACAVGVVGWLALSTVGVVYETWSRSRAEAEVAQTQAKYERWIADRQARLDSALAQLNAPTNSVVDLANALEKRHAALAMLLTEARDVPGAAQALTPVLAQPAVAAAASPTAKIQAVQVDQ